VYERVRKERVFKREKEREMGEKEIDQFSKMKNFFRFSTEEMINVNFVHRYDQKRIGRLFSDIAPSNSLCCVRHTVFHWFFTFGFENMEKIHRIVVIII